MTDVHHIRGPDDETKARRGGNSKAMNQSSLL